MPNDRDVESTAPNISIEASADGRTWVPIDAEFPEVLDGVAQEIAGLLRLPPELLVVDPVASRQAEQTRQLEAIAGRLDFSLGEQLRRALEVSAAAWSSMRPRIETDLSEAPLDLTRLAPAQGRRLLGPRGTGSLDADLRWAARPRPALGIFAPGLVLGATFKADDDGVIRVSATWGLGGTSSWTTTTVPFRNDPGPGLTVDALRQAWESFRAVAEPIGRTRIVPIEWMEALEARVSSGRCGECEGCRRQAQFEHLTHFVAGDQVQAFLEYARRGEREPFVELAGVLGVAPELHEDMWTGTVALVAGRRPAAPRSTEIMDELEPEPAVPPEQAAIYPADPNDYGTGPDDELAIQKMAARARVRTAAALSSGPDRPTEGAA